MYGSSEMVHCQEARDNNVISVEFPVFNLSFYSVHNVKYLSATHLLAL